LKNEYLEMIRTQPEFAKAVEEIIKMRPTIPPHDFNEDNTEQWKSMSAQQRGFDLCIYLFTGRS